MRLLELAGWPSWTSTTMYLSSVTPPSKENLVHGGTKSTKPSYELKHVWMDMAGISRVYGTLPSRQSWVKKYKTQRTQNYAPPVLVLT
jgi:hypothetical protein